MKIVLTGATGQLGAHILPLLRGHHVIAPTRAQLDLSDAAAVEKFIHASKPDLVINPAAYTAVDLAEQDSDAAFRVNAAAPEAMAQACKDVGALLIHYSTDYVFNGQSTQPWKESDLTAPLSVYGASKLAGEMRIADVGGSAIILRTSWVYSKIGKNFLLTMQRLAAQKDALRVVADQHGTPNWAATLAQATADVVNRFSMVGLKAKAGTYHLSSHGATSWHGFASAIVNAGARHIPVHAITTQEYPTSAARPAYSVLDGGKFERTFGLRLPFWGDALKACMQAEPPFQ